MALTLGNEVMYLDMIGGFVSRLIGGIWRICRIDDAQVWLQEKLAQGWKLQK